MSETVLILRGQVTHLYFLIFLISNQPSRQEFYLEKRYYIFTCLEAGEAEEKAQLWTDHGVVQLTRCRAILQPSELIILPYIFESD